MSDVPPIQFNDGAAYEHFMGPWTRMVGNLFLDWLKPATGLAWLDVGCGNGASTELIAGRCAPSAISAVDPSEAQLAFARQRTTTNMAQYMKGDAMALPYPDTSFDAVVMALVIFFVPDPAKAVGEMVRVARPGGIVATYAWDFMHDGSPTAPMWEALNALGLPAARPISQEASRIEALKGLWTDASVQEIETREFVVERHFANFDDYWKSSVLNSPTGQAAKLPETSKDVLKAMLRARLPCDLNGQISYHSRATAIKGRVPS